MTNLFINLTSLSTTMNSVPIIMQNFGVVERSNNIKLSEEYAVLDLDQVSLKGDTINLFSIRDVLSDEIKVTANTWVGATAWNAMWARADSKLKLSNAKFS